ncbi:MAG: hypothetical protein BroJett025_10640 [Patescibacteria group bacterium]|nr:MAG: hypothetical protein BroJett025_10640 [Patescibacteria group bacterium]
MKQNNLVGKIGVIVSYAALFFVATYFGKSVEYSDGLFFVVGLLVGLALLEADEAVLFKYYADTESKKRLATRSLLFILALFPLGIFLLTSTGSALGVGMYLSIISGLALEFFSLRKNKLEFKERFLYQLKRDISIQEQQLFTAVFISTTVMYAFFVIFLGR